MSPAPIKTVSGNIRNILAAYCTTLPARRDQDIRIKCYHRKSGPVPASLLSLLKDKHCVICFACYTALRRGLSWEMWGNCDGLFKRNFKIWNVSNGLSLHMLMWAVARAVSGRVGCPHKVSGRGVCSYLCGDYPSIFSIQSVSSLDPGRNMENCRQFSAALHSLYLYRISESWWR